MDSIDNQFINENRKDLPPDAYAGFGPRLGALLLDGLVLVPVTVCVFINMYKWQSQGFFIFLTAVNLVYKPFMEFRYGTTVGKMAAGIRVVSLELNQPTLQEVIFRNCFHIAFVILSACSSLWLMGQPGFNEVRDFQDYSLFAKTHNKYNLLLGLIPGSVTLADGIVMLTDPLKRSIHDMFGKTYVVKNNYLFRDEGPAS